jgi:hypothetical protein
MSTLLAISIGVCTHYLLKNPKSVTKLVIEALAWRF